MCICEISNFGLQSYCFSVRYRNIIGIFFIFWQFSFPETSFPPVFFLKNIKSRMITVKAGSA